jgi:hypothetical protein
MSRGLGRVQRKIDDALKAEPSRRFTVEELAEIAYPGVAIDIAHLSATRRALNKLPVNRHKVGNANSTGWSYRVVFAG